MVEKTRQDAACTMNYDKLLQAIDFFSQSLHLEQLSYYGYEIVHEILGLEHSALFVRENGRYLLKYQKGYAIDAYSIPETLLLKKVATLFGRIMTTEQREYFDKADLAAFDVRFVFPLIVKDQLVGFIFSNGGDGLFETDRLVLAGALMQLMSRAYENAVNFLELEKKNYELDKKIFNLFFINHCSRTLLAELNLEKIYDICIDIIRELTASSVTAFGLYDETRDRILIKGYQDILTFQSFYGEFQLVPDAPLQDRIVYHVVRDREALSRVFLRPEELDQLKAEYIVMLVKDRILGFVSIGRPVSDRVYDQTLFELIETIATSIYLSVVNAQLFEKIQLQSESLRVKYETLKNMNRIIRNINSCESLEELCAIAMQSLEIGYGVKKGFICLYQGDELKVMGDIRIPHINGHSVTESETLRNLKETGIHYDYNTSGLKQFFPDFEPSRHEDANCLIIAPVTIDRMVLGDEGILGYLVVFETASALKEEEVLLIDTLANSIAPILFQMRETARIQSNHVENSEQLLLAAVREKLENRGQYFIEFRICYSKIVRRPFEEPDLSAYSGYETYLVGEWLIAAVEEDIPAPEFDGEFQIADIEDFLRQVKLL